MDKIAPNRRSENMRRIRSKDTQPELAVRRICRNLGFTGYRVHRKDIIGKPDLAWFGKKLAVFVHGCFWHGHDCAEGLRKPKTNRNYWLPKLKRNHQRDIEHVAALRATGWRVLTIWECEMHNKKRLVRKIDRFIAKTTPNYRFQSTSALTRCRG